MRKQSLIIGIALSLVSLCYAQVPKAGLVAYFPFDTSSVSEISGNSRTLSSTSTAGNYTLIEEGKFGKGLSTSATGNNHSLHSSDASFRFTSSFSISVWLRADGQFSSAYSVIAGNRRHKDFSIYTNYGLLFNTVNSQLQFVVADSAIGTYLTSTDFSKWMHVVATYERGMAKLYINGVLMAESNSFPTGIQYGAAGVDYYLNEFQLGNFSGIGNHSYQQLMDEVAVYDRALSKRDVLALYFATNNQLDQVPNWNLVDVNGMVIDAQELSGKDSSMLAVVANGENWLWDLNAKIYLQHTYGEGQKLADEFKMASNGNTLLRKGPSVYFKNPAGNYITVPGFNSGAIALNSTMALCSGNKFSGLYKLENFNWTSVLNNVIIPRMDLANDGTLGLLASDGSLSFIQYPSLALVPAPNQQHPVQSISVVDSTLSFVATFDGEVYKIERGLWTLISSLPYVNRVLALSDGTIFGVSNKMVYRYKENFTKGSQPTSMRENLENAKFALFPNPGNTTIHLAIDLKDCLELQALSMDGKSYMLGIDSNNAIDISFLPNGLYLVKAKLDGNKVIETKLVVIH